MSSLRIIALLAAVIATLVIVAANSGPPVSALADPVVSVDTVSDSSNTATTVGPVDTCRLVNLGDSFQTDVVIQSVTDIAGFQANLLYNSAVLKVTAVNYNFILASTGASVIELGDTVPDTDGDFLFSAAMFSLLGITGADGAGVLVRLTLQAVGTGISLLELTNVKLADSASSPIPPSDAAGVYIGPINDGKIAVDSSCVSGDVDCNDTLSVVDATLILYVLGGIIASLACPDAADVDGVGGTTVVDATLILYLLGGIISEFP